MKNRIIGILIFLFFIAVPYLLEGGDLLRMVPPSPLLIVFGPAIGLTVAHYRKGMDKQVVLKKAKKYLIVSGVLGTLLGIILSLGVAPLEATPASMILRKFSASTVSTFYGILCAFIVDTFIEEK